MKKKTTKKDSVPSKKVLGKYCHSVCVNLPIMWKSVGRAGDGLGGRAVKNADTVDVVAYSDYNIPGYSGGVALLVRTTIRAIVEECVEASQCPQDGLIYGRKSIADFKALESRLREAADYVAAHLSNPTADRRASQEEKESK